MKLISWNVNGLRACMQKGFADFFNEIDADIFAVQETKMQDGQLDASFAGYHCYHNAAMRKGYSGVMVWSKQEPLNVTYGLGIEEHDQEGRVINIFGKTVEQLVKEGIQNKIDSIGEDSQKNLQETMQKILNESKGGMIFIII